MRIERQTRRSSLNPTYLACGCLTVLIGGGLFLALVGIFVLPGLILQLGGFESRGSTAALFEEVTPPPTVEIENASTGSSDVVIDLGRFGTETLNNNLYDYTVVTGNTSSGAQIATVSFDEANLLALCRQRSDICGPSNPQFRNARFDLKPGGAIVHGEILVPQIGLWQNAGIVLNLVNNRRLQVAGVDIGGSLYAVPPNEFSNVVSEVERIGNETLDQMIVQAGGTQYNLDTVLIDESNLTLVLR